MDDYRARYEAMRAEWSRAIDERDRCHDALRAQNERQRAELGKRDRRLAGAVDDLAEAVALLDNARCDLNDPALKRSWARQRKALAAKWGR